MTEQIAPGIYSWTAAHPEWRTRIEWGHRVASYALVSEDILVLIDPLLPAEDSPEYASVLAELDGLAEGSLALEIMITIPYHTRSAEALYLRYLGSEPHPRLWGHKAVAKRLTDPSVRLDILRPAEAVEQHGRPLAVPYPIGNPRRYETPLWFPESHALAFGDAVVGSDDGLRVWQPGPFSPAWYREKFLPTMIPLLELPVERVLVTHGPAVLQDGREALRRALESPPWDPERLTPTS